MIKRSECTCPCHQFNNVFHIMPCCDGDDTLRDATTRMKVFTLHNEVDCRIEHGAESGGHLEYVRDKLKEILDA